MIATLGRKTLTDTLNSIHPQLQNGDELIVVADDAGDWHGASRRTTYAHRRIKEGGIKTHFARGPSNEEGRGYAQRAFGMQFAAAPESPDRTSHIVFIDDDDIYAEDAFEAIREHADPKIPTIFKMMYGSDTYAHVPGDTLWDGERLEYGNVGTPMFVVPNIRKNLGRWKAHTEHDGIACGGDFTFINESVQKFGGVKWQDHVIALIRPKGRQ